MLGGIGGRRRGRQRMRWLNDITDPIDANLSELRELVMRPGVLRFMGSQRVGHDWATDWTELMMAVESLTASTWKGLNIWGSKCVLLCLFCGQPSHVTEILIWDVLGHLWLQSLLLGGKFLMPRYAPPRGPTLTYDFLPSGAMLIARICPPCSKLSWTP